jgi:nucleoside 2-deoxyribosyltransferase
MTKLVYVAGPLFSEAERGFLQEMVEAVAQVTGLHPVRDFFVPHRDGGELGKGPKRNDIFDLDIQHVDSATLVIALLDGQDVDSGTCIELGYAYARGKKIMGLLTDFRAYCTNDHEPHRPNLMVWGVCERGNTLFRNVNELAKAVQKYLEHSSSTQDDTNVKLSSSKK